MEVNENIRFLDFRLIIGILLEFNSFVLFLNNFEQTEL